MTRRITIFFVLWLVVLAASVTAYVQPGETTEPDSYFATIVKRVGDVSYRAPFSAHWSRISDDAKLAAGTAISTKANSSVVLETRDGHILNIGSRSQIVLSGLDRHQRASAQVFLLNGTVSMSPGVPRQSGSEGLIQRVTTVVRFGKRLTNILDNALGSERKKVEIATRNLSVNLTQSQLPVVISAVDDKINILTKDPTVTAHIGERSLGVLPANKALSIVSNSGESKLIENVERRVFENLITFSEQAAQEALVVNRKPTATAGTPATDVTPAQGLPLEIESKRPTESTPKVNVDAAAVGKKPIGTGNTQAAVKPSPVKARPVKPISPPRPQATALSFVNQSDGKRQSRELHSVPTPVPTPLPAPTFSATPDSVPPMTRDWQLITPRGGIELLPLDIDSLLAMDPMRFEYKYLGEKGTEPENPSLEVFNVTNNNIRIFVSPEQNKGKNGIRQFRLSGSQLSELVTKSKGDRNFLFRIVKAKDSGTTDASSSNPEKIELKSLDDLGEGIYSISTSEYQRAKPGQKRVPFIFEKNDEVLPSDRVEFVTQSRSALNTLLSNITPGTATSIKRNQPLRATSIGTHFIDSSALIFSVFPARRAEESLKSEWISSGPERIVFEGRISDFIRPESIVSALREGEPNQTIQVVSEGEIFSTRLINMRKMPGAAKRLAQERLALFRAKTPLRVGDWKQSLALKSKPPSSFVQSTYTGKHGLIGIILVASNGSVSFPTLEQLGFFSPTIFTSIPKVEIEKLMKAQSFILDARLLKKESARELFSLFADGLKANLLLIVSEKLDGELINDIYGKNYNGALVHRSFSARRISDLQRLFFKSLDYDGIVTASERKWINVFSHGDPPTRGQWVAIYDKAQSEIWLPILDKGESPTALAVCEIVQKQGCWARIFSIEKSASEVELLGAKSKWL